MIDEELTNSAFGYYSWELKPKSNQRIIVACDRCDKIREVSKEYYRKVCRSCIMTGKHHTEDQRAKQREATKGEKNHFFNKEHTDETKALMSKSHANISGEKNPNYKGGKKLASKRHSAKRRNLGDNILMPLKEGEDGHHCTDEDIIGVPHDVHSKIGGRQKKHRALILEWLKENDTEKYELVLSVLNK